MEDSEEASVSGGRQWRAGDLAWIVAEGSVSAAVVASVMPLRLTLAMGSTRHAYERGFSPRDPSLFHTREEALAYLQQSSSRIWA